MAALLESTAKAQQILPLLGRSIEEMGKVESLFLDYNRQLKIMGHEIQQLASLNLDLETQTQNQKSLLGELERLLGKLQVPKEALVVLERSSLEQAESLDSLLEAAGILYGVLGSKFERGIRDIRGIHERLAYVESCGEAFETRVVGFLMVILAKAQPALAASRKRGPQRMSLCQLATMDAQLQPYARLIEFLGQKAPQRFLDFKLAYEAEARKILTAELVDIIEAMKGHNLIRKDPLEKGYCMGRMR